MQQKQVLLSLAETPKTPTSPPLRDHGISEEDIQRLVHRFYDAVHKDALLAPIFSAYISDWDAHLTKMCYFWSSIMLGTGKYSGKPIEAHRSLPEMTEMHFAHWLNIFERTASDLFSAEIVSIFMDKATLMGRSIARSLGIVFAEEECSGGCACRQKR